MDRQQRLTHIVSKFAYNPAVAILGPRQCGKTTLAKAYVAQVRKQKNVHYFDLEDVTDLERLATPKLTLGELEGLIVIDEIQRQPELFPTLRVLIDDVSKQQQFLILGSASQELIKQTSETLAGRISYIELTPFDFSETANLKKLWLYGGFPKSYLANNIDNSVAWRKDYIKTFLERDIPNLGFNIPANQLRRFWMMLAHYHGSIFNAVELGNSLSISSPTVKRYLDILVGTFMIRELQPWLENIKKRQVKSPKIYFRDSGIFHTLLAINTYEELLVHPKLGASWEGVAMEEIIRYHGAEQQDCYFWAVHQQAELDLLIYKDNKKMGFEFKYTDKPKLTKSMFKAFELLELDNMVVIYPGKKDFPLSDNIRAVGLINYLTY